MDISPYISVGSGLALASTIENAYKRDRNFTDGLNSLSVERRMAYGPDSLSMSANDESYPFSGWPFI